MAKLTWDQSGERLYEIGVRNGVLYPQANDGSYPLGVAWNGLSAITESPSGAEPTAIYADDIKYLNILSAEEFGATIEAYTYPDEFALLDGSAALETGVMIGQQDRATFGLCYRTAIGNDITGLSYGYKLHLIYGAVARPSEKGYQTVNDSPEAITFSWEIATTPVNVAGKRPTATLVIDSTKVNSATLLALEDLLYGTAGSDPRMPLPAEIAALFTAGAPDPIALSSIVPADLEAAAAIDANVVLTFNNPIQSDSVVVVSAGGAVVGGTKTWTVGDTVLTFNPTSNFAPGTTYIVTIASVVDVYGQTLDTVTKTFTTAS